VKKKEEGWGGREDHSTVTYLFTRRLGPLKSISGIKFADSKPYFVLPQRRYIYDHNIRQHNELYVVTAVSRVI